MEYAVGKICGKSGSSPSGYKLKSKADVSNSLNQPTSCLELEFDGEGRRGLAKKKKRIGAELPVGDG